MVEQAMKRNGVNIDIDVWDFEAIKQFILDHSVSLVVVGRGPIDKVLKTTLSVAM